jgi:hypothetical protein
MIKPAVSIAFAALALAAFAATPADARRHSERWYLAHGYHRGPVKGFVKGQPTPEPAAENVPAAAPEPPDALVERLHIIRPIVNGRLVNAWVGSPPSWAGSLYVSPLLAGRSASAQR